jgi:aspartate aminotransferase
MTGWRVGWLVAPPALLNGLNIIVAAQVNNLPTFVQRGALAALRGPQECARDMLQAYRDRRDLAITVLRSHGVLSYLPAGAFYLLINLAQGSDDSDAAPAASPSFDSVRFAESLIAERAIAVAPGAAFGSRTNGAVRVSLASSPDTLRKGITGLLEFARGYPGTAV